MEQRELKDAMMKLFAYDSGSPQSGIRDDHLKERIIEYLGTLSSDEFRVLMTPIMREAFFSDEAIQEGYGIEDAKSFFGWLSDEIGIDL